jgi:two-component system NarL family sensor kinase
MDMDRKSTSGKTPSLGLSDLPIQSTLDALSTPVALLDEVGDIIGANAAWRDLTTLFGFEKTDGFARNNYLQVCEAAAGDPVARSVLSSRVKSVLSGRHRVFEHTCRFTSGGATRDFNVRLTHLERYVPARFLVSLEEITHFAQAEGTAREMDERVFEVQAEERQRLAAELHDSIGQSLVSLDLWLTRLRMTAGQADGVAQIIADMSAAVREAHSEIRTLSYLLRPPWPEEPGGLEKAVQQFVEGFAQRASIAAETKVYGGPCQIGRARELALFRILQEALVNVHRHAHAQTVRVELTSSNTMVMLKVSDDGHGFPSTESASAAQGVGILGMQSRIAHFGGELEIDSTGNGTTIVVVLPLSQDSDEK